MKKFLEEFNKANEKLLQETESEVLIKQKDYYNSLVGKKAIYYTKLGEPRVVSVVKAYPTFLLLQYKTYSTSGRPTTMSVCSHYGSLYCGDDRLCLE